MSQIPVTFSAEQQEGTESIISQWFKRVGDTVKEHEPLVEISTDKVNVEIAAPASGTVVEILCGPNDKITPGQILARIQVGAFSDTKADTFTMKSTQPSPTHPETTTNRSQELSPAVKKLLKEHGVSADQIQGTGAGSRITHQDVLDFIASNKNQSSNARQSNRKQLSPMRKSIAEHMTKSLLHTAPHVTTIFEVDMSNVISHREKHKADFEKRGARLTFTSYFIQAAIKAIHAVPEANASYHDDGIEIFEDCNIGIAVATTDAQGESGLIVPVVMQAQKLDLFEIAKTLMDLTEKARTQTLSTQEVRSGTFTISNHGVSGSLVATPIIINQPQSAILGIGKLEKRVCVIEKDGKDSIEIRPKLFVSLTIDHRVLDGFKANAFLQAFCDFLITMK